MRVIDFRVRPPCRGFADTIMFREIERTARMAKDVGLDVGELFRHQSVHLLLAEMDRAGIDKAVMLGPGELSDRHGSQRRFDRDRQ